jgi:hypothetical protein
MDEGGERGEHSCKLKRTGGERFTVKSRLIRIDSVTPPASRTCAVTNGGEKMNVPDATRRTVLVYEPVAEAGKNQDALAQRLPTLDGKVIGLLNNTKDLVDVLLGEVKNLLQKDFPGVEFRDFRKESVSGATPELLEQMATCDAVVTAVGD